MPRHAGFRLVANAALAGAFLVLFVGPSHSQANLPPTKVMPKGDLAKVNPKLADAGSAKSPGTTNEKFFVELPKSAVTAPDADLTDPATKRSYFAYRQKLYEYEQWSLVHTKKVYEWQLGKSEAVFWIVLFLVALGIVLSWQQFQSDLKHRARRHALPAGVLPADPALPPPTQFKASLQGIEVNSSLVGVVILTISLAFFYLYIVHVYTISGTN